VPKADLETAALPCEGADAWLNPRLSLCTELTGDGPAGVILETWNKDH
jgi:hypothetical protein